MEVWLAKEGHGGPVGINYLEKVQLGLAPGMFGAILAGADCVLVGAGVPGYVPEPARRLARREPVTVRIRCDGTEVDYEHQFDPVALLERTGSGTEACAGAGQGRPARPLRRPDVLAIVSLPLLASYLARDEATAPDGFVIETHGAGGHSAPPRGALRRDARGEPLYGPRDQPDLARMAGIGRARCPTPRSVRPGVACATSVICACPTAPPRAPSATAAPPDATSHRRSPSAGTWASWRIRARAAAPTGRWTWWSG